MLHDQIFIELSAYADGELDAVSVRALEQKLAADPRLKAELDAFKRLDQAALKIPVPNVEAKLAGLCRNVAGADLKQASVERIASELKKVPDVSAARFEKIWQKIAAQTVAVPADEREAIKRSAQFDGEAAGSVAGSREAAIWRKLDDAAAQLPVPQMSELASREAWHTIAQQTVALTPAEKHLNERIDTAAMMLPVPMPNDEAFARRWSSVAEQVTAAPAGVKEGIDRGVPQVSQQRWNAVWKEIAGRTVQAKAAAAPHAPVHDMPATAVKEKVTRIDFARPRRKSWNLMAAASMAAMLMAAVLLFVSNKEETQVAMEIPEALDERYDVHVKYLEGQSEPVVCFFLKDEVANAENHLNEFRWLPD
ncbi:MAG TPA: hypothetical protein VEK08_00795 [Planctomycetota bacterium]|nr:hypothetical protein [Planctomycetota bacterium]